jgi:hypothetical protein
MDEKTKEEILEKARVWMRNELILAHKANTLKLANSDEFIINPFLLPYLANFLEGNSDFKTLAKVLIYPRVLGSSINTSFGQRTQQLITKLFEGISGSTTSGIDIEFMDKKDNKKKYCQVKAGPNVINSDDVTTIKNHFRDLLRLAKTNNLDINNTNLMFCLLYGESSQQNTFITEIGKEYTVSTGQDFWYRFTGDKNFYKDLIKAFSEVANEVNMKKVVNSVINELAKDLEKKYKNIL